MTAAAGKPQYFRDKALSGGEALDHLHCVLYVLLL